MRVVPGSLYYFSEATVSVRILPESLQKKRRMNWKGENSPDEINRIDLFDSAAKLASEMEVGAWKALWDRIDSHHSTSIQPVTIVTFVKNE